MTQSLTFAFLLGALAALGCNDASETPEPDAAPEDVAPVAEASFDGGEAGFAVQVGEVAIPYRRFGIYVLPGETVSLTPLLAGDADVRADVGALSRDGRRWQWVAPPEPGLTRLTVESASGETIALSAFVMRPYAGEETLRGYRIGQYQPGAYQGNDRYRPPEGFVEVTPALLNAPVSPHFTLGQFVCKQASGYPKYLALDERLLLKLERLLAAVNAAGVEAETFAVLSGYRTPFYNAAIGNRTTRGRHLYGDAADVYVDTDGNGTMDDLTGDGAITVADAEWMASVVDSLQGRPWYAPLVGGLGVYAPAPHRGPFIHVDTRGAAVRW